MITPIFSDKKMGMRRNEIICTGLTANECGLELKFRSAVWALNHYPSLPD